MMISHFKLLLSIVVASLFMIVIRQSNNYLSEQGRERAVDTITARHMQQIANLIQFDFSRLGLNLKGNDQAIIEAKPHRIVFKSDFDLDGVVETIRYYLSDSTAAGSTENPHDKILYRVVDDQPDIDVPLGVTTFELKYYDWPEGNETTDLTKIRTIEVNLQVQNTFSVDDTYAGYSWRTRTSPPNLALR